MWFLSHTVEYNHKYIYIYILVICGVYPSEKHCFSPSWNASSWDFHIYIYTYVFSSCLLVSIPYAHMKYPMKYPIWLLLIISHTYWSVVDLPLWKILVSFSWDDDIPNWMESHKSHVPNHQPVLYIYIFWLVVSNIFFVHNIWDNPSHWLIFFKMVKTTNQCIYIYSYDFWILWADHKPMVDLLSPDTGRWGPSPRPHLRLRGRSCDGRPTGP